MMIVLWVGLAILWTVLVLIAGYASGRVDGEKRAELMGDTSDPAYVVNVTGPETEVVEQLQERMAALDSQMQALTELQQNAPVDISMGAQRRLEMIEPLMKRIEELEEVVDERDSGYRDRFTRVERRAGMSV